jgi:serine/threonine-protein kinase
MPKPEAPPDLLRVPNPGEIVADKYRVEKSLGGGGMGVVVAATHLTLHERVALKFLHPRLVGREVTVSRFLREAQTAARIKSEHVTRVLDVATLPSGVPFMVLELLEGQDLGRLLRARGPLPVAEAVGLVVQACAGVAEAHALGIVHRDLKPANLFLTRKSDGTPLVKVLDFGISKVGAADQEGNPELTLTVTDDVLGSPQYMAPEQLRSPKGVDARADVWSLGMILYRLTTGECAFEGETAASLLAALAADEPIPMRRRRADIPVELEAIVMRCLTKNREVRYRDAAELAEALVPFAPLTLAFPAGFRFGATNPGSITGSGDGYRTPMSQGTGASGPAPSATPPAGPDATHGAWTTSSTPRRRGPALAIAGVVTIVAAALFAGILLGRTQAGPAAGSSSDARGPSPDARSSAAPLPSAQAIAPGADPSTSAAASTAPSAAATAAPSAAPSASASADAPTSPAKPPRRGGGARPGGKGGVDPLDERL